MARVVGVGAVMIYARDPAALAGWYGANLGIPTTHNAEESCYYGEIGGTAEGKGTQFAIMAARQPLAPDCHAVMINYRVEDLDSLLAELRGQGVSVERTEEDQFGRFAYVTDPEGNPIELWEASEG
jgi:predicted enzyme related to lactoylglutathione lyase